MPRVLLDGQEPRRHISNRPRLKWYIAKGQIWFSSGFEFARGEFRALNSGSYFAEGNVTGSRGVVGKR